MKIIAVEEHFTTSMFARHAPANQFRRAFLDQRSTELGFSIEEQLADLGEKRLAQMDAAGIDVQVLSFGQPGPQAFAPEIAIPLARDANDRLFEAIQKHPDRFAGFAALPTADPEAAAKEFERAVTQLGFTGAIIHGHTGGSFLDDRRYWVIFACAQALGVPIYLHPAVPHPNAVKAYFEGYEELMTAGLGFEIDTSSHFLRIVFAGVFDAYPRLKFILGHLGECLPFTMHRLNEHTRGAAARRGLRKTPMQYIKDHVLVTTSGNFFAPAFSCALLALGVESILFAVDWPYDPSTSGVDFLRNLQISDADRAKIAHLNAERVLRL
jgi:predicted TIM-barrel fold metal-dependent hydrolase